MGKSLDFGARIYDCRLGRYLSVDPYFSGLPQYSHYQYSGNSPISVIDVDGKWPKWFQKFLDLLLGTNRDQEFEENPRKAIKNEEIRNEVAQVVKDAEDIEEAVFEVTATGLTWTDLNDLYVIVTMATGEPKNIDGKPTTPADQVASVASVFMP